MRRRFALSSRNSQTGTPAVHRILEGYQRYVRLELDKRHVLVESATELERGTRDKLRRALKAKYGETSPSNLMSRLN
jgi:F0F1-type ATP synthase delta subunit